jgi:hypothetical protein
MTRRAFVALPLTAQAAAAPANLPLVVPVLHIMDTRANCAPDRIRRFSSVVWPEAVRDFARCGIVLRSRSKDGEVRRSPGGRPILAGLERGAVNMVLTGGIPLAWDRGRGLEGISARHEGYWVCVLALNEAGPHRVPFFSVNTCVHELLHVLLDDVLEDRPQGWREAARELRIDAYATRMWLFGDGAAIRKAARSWVAAAGATAGAPAGA